MSEGEKAFNPLFDSPPGVEVVASAPVEVDPALVEEYLDELRAQQSLVGGLAGGVISTVIGAAIWAIVTVITDMQFEFVAIGLGLLVGMGVRKYGHGLTPRFGVMAAILAALGTILGNILSCGPALAKVQGVPLFDAEIQLLTSPVLALAMTAATLTVFGTAFIIAALIAAYLIAFRDVSKNDAIRMIRNATYEEYDA